MPEVFRGELDSVSLAGLLQLVESESLHGKLSFPRGELACNNGLVSGASYRSLEGSAAVVEALVRARGAFAFRAGGAVPEGALGQTLGLVMESCRVMDEFERIGPQHLQRTDELERAGLDLDLRLFARALDGTRPVAQLIAERDMALVTTLPWLAEQIEAGALTHAGQTDLSAVDLLHQADAAVPEADEAPANGAANAAPATEVERADAPAPADGRTYDDLIFEARFQAKRREYGAAEQTLLAALAVRPGDRIAAQNLSRVRSLRAMHS